MNVEKVLITEVCPRDGFQNIDKFIETPIKIEVVEKLINAGFRKIQVTSFVNPKAVPQMKDAAEVAKFMINKYPDIRFTALVPNLRGAQLASDCGIKEISYVISASERHNQENVRRSISESFEELKQIKTNLPDLKVKVDVATAFGCPFVGDISMEQVIMMIEKSMEIGADEIFLADTIGVANPRQVDNMLKELKSRYPGLRFGFHLHDTRGMGLPNTFVAIENGYDKFESAAGGLGGCPFAPGAAGNVATEDLVNMLHSMGIETGIDLGKLLETTVVIKENIKPDLVSHMSHVSIVQNERC
jgi:hydroxymethylglutaryl-CoA lyase